MAVPLPVDPERLRREFPALDDGDLVAWAELTRRILVDPRQRGRILAEVLSLAARASEKRAGGVELEPAESTALAYVAALRKMQRS
jgi:hypothetical protein